MRGGEFCPNCGCKGINSQCAKCVRDSEQALVATHYDPTRRGTFYRRGKIEYFLPDRDAMLGKQPSLVNHTYAVSSPRTQIL